jgi:anti-sigma regulatory factor (Ser/Thr protein kinase)
MQSITLQSEPQSVGRARHFVTAACVERHVEPLVAELLTSELATNVVLHVKREFTVRVGFALCVRVEVHDGLAATNVFREIITNPPACSIGSPGGRGLPLVGRLASRFGLDDDLGIWHGKIVWFELDAEP